MFKNIILRKGCLLWNFLNNVKHVNLIFLEYVPEWKQKLIFNVTNYLHCPIHLAKEVARVDKLNWQIHSNDILNDSEKILVDWVSKTAKKQNQTAVSIEYSLDRATLPHFHATYRKNK